MCECCCQWKATVRWWLMVDQGAEVELCTSCVKELRAAGEPVERCE